MPAARRPATGTPGLVMVSNRLPFEVRRQQRRTVIVPSPGGLVAALRPTLKARGGVWVGWPGDSRAAIPRADEEGVRYQPVALSDREVAQYYGAFANRTIWPLFHYFVGRTRIDEGAWTVYERVNERFAQAAADAAAGGGALVWVHDYQLMRVPHHLRRLAPATRLAFFLHIPFPALDVFRILPWARDLLRGVLAADLIGFHVPSYVEHFLEACERLLGCAVDRDAGTVLFEGREVAVQAHPLGIDVAAVEGAAERLPAPAPRTVRTILGVDRLDYTKGIHERLLAVERLLERHPEYRRRIEFTQIAVPSRERVAEYQLLKREIDEAVGRINGRFAEGRWSPIRYLARSLPLPELVAQYAAADVALVTPLRDGMNLVAKEYVASQVRGEGVLVLSELAGAADELQEAVLVNPFDVEAVARALHRALAMPDDERRARMSALRARVEARPVLRWALHFLDAVDAGVRRSAAVQASPADTVRRLLAPWLRGGASVGLFLDYDGTLTPIVDHPTQAVLAGPARQALEQAIRTPNLDVVIVSGRSLADLKQMVGIEGLTYIGTHGHEIDGAGISFRHPALGTYREALERAAQELEAAGVTGAWVERKPAAVAFHVRGVAERALPDAMRRAEAVLRRRRLQPLSGKRVVEGRLPVDWDKGEAVNYVLVRRHGADWASRVRALYIGDDTTDEDAFEALRGVGRSIAVSPRQGTGPRGADFSLPDPDSVIELVRWLASGAFSLPARGTVPGA